MSLFELSVSFGWHSAKTHMMMKWYLLFLSVLMIKWAIASLLCIDIFNTHSEWEAAIFPFNDDCFSHSLGEMDPRGQIWRELALVQAQFYVQINFHLKDMEDLYWNVSFTRFFLVVSEAISFGYCFPNFFLFLSGWMVLPMTINKFVTLLHPPPNQMYLYSILFSLNHFV